uniref:Coagulation factor VIII, procoagulant component n=1 Tax=Cyclopterus lumpus TaxID=8103 RepID=A0A8C2WSE7_CYCLU
MCQGRKHVFWHLIGIGTTPEIHSIQFQDHTLQVLNHRKVNIEVTPMTFITAEMRPATSGRFLMSCQIHAHRHDGMNAFFTVEKCPDPVILPGPDLRNVKHKANVVSTRASRGQHSITWEHYIAVEEVTWEYTLNLKPTDRRPCSVLQSEDRYLVAPPHHLGYKYKKAVYKEYTDGSFTKRKNPDTTLLGPLLKGKVNDQIHITLRNLASHPFNIYPIGLTNISPLQRSKDLRSMEVPPNGTFSYVWRLTTEDGPLGGDPQCLTQLYQSTVSRERDLASGLVGTLLICKYNSMDTRGHLLGPDKEWSLIFAVFDENRSWYFNENMQKSSQNFPNITDPEFYKSNVIHSINGEMFPGRQFVASQNDIAFWHVANVGTQSDFLSVYFTGNVFQYHGLYQSVLTLFPMTGITVPMETELIGEWEISAYDGSLKSKGMSIHYTVRQSEDGYRVDGKEIPDDISDYLDLQPRGRRPKNGTVLVPVCKKPLANNNTQSGNTSAQDVTCDKTESTGGEEHSASQLKEVTATSPEGEGGIPQDILEEIERAVERTVSQNVNQPGGEGDLEESNEILLDRNPQLNEKKSTVGLSNSEEMDQNLVPLNNIRSEPERLTADLRVLEYNGTVDNNITTGLELSLEYDDYEQEVPFSLNGTSDVFGMDYMDPRSGETRYRHYYIAAEEISWDYGIRKPHQFIKPREMRRGMRKFLPEYKKVVFRAYADEHFLVPLVRGEQQEHLGIMGPFIRAEINDVLTVVFKNKASRPYSFHLQGVYDLSQGAGFDKTHSPSAPSGVPGEPVAPGKTQTYNWSVTRKQGPTDTEFDCKTGSYYSTVDKEKDLHSGLIGPLVICKSGTLRTRQNTQPNVQEFALLFHTFDETKSWYLEESLRRHCAPPCQANTEDPWYHISNKFAAINGYVAETLPGLLVAQHQLIRWHLLNVGSDGEYHAVQFHGLPFTVHNEKEHRMGVYNLFPGVFGMVEMRPSTIGTWLVECTIGDYQLAGMRAKLLVYNPGCRVPLGMQSGRIEDSQITASDYIDNWEPRLARLDQSGYINAWMGRNKMSWIQVDLQRPTLLHGVQTQGVRSKLRDNYIALFHISYSLDQETWTTYRGNGTKQNKLFYGNMDSSKVKNNLIDPPFVARYVRIQPLSFVQKPALRLELLGCDLNSCSLPLGLKDRRIPDNNITASSFYSTLMRSWSPKLARLHQKGSANAWRPKNNNPHEWLQVDLGKVSRITGVITQGAQSLLTEIMVTEFSVTISHDGHSWTSVLEESSQREKIFTGNSDSDAEALSVFDPPLFGRYFRIHPRGWFNGIALRLEVLGCDTQQGP